MSSRAFILDRVRRNQPAPLALPEMPRFERPQAPLWEAFAAALARMGGVVADAPAPGQLDRLVSERFPAAKVICSATPELRGTRELADIHTPGELEDVDLGIVRGAFGIAETGSVYLSESELGINALGFLPQHLLVLLDPAAIVPDLHHAYRQRGFFDSRYAVLMTGPSATADIEGVLIRGAQGIRSFTLVPLANPAASPTPT